MKGRLNDRPLELLMFDIPARAPSGVLTIERGPAKKQICFLKGSVRLAVSNLLEDRFAEYLIRTQAFPEELVREAEASLPEGQHLRQHLATAGVIPPAALKDLVRAHILDIVVPCLDWKVGEYRFEPGVPNIVSQVATDIPVLEFVLEKARRKVGGDDVDKLLRDREVILAVAASSGKDLARLELSQAEALVLARAEEGDTLGSLLTVAPSLRGPIARAAASLVAAGIVYVTPKKDASQRSIYDTHPPGLAGRGKAAAEPEPGNVPAEVRYYRQMHDLLLGADHYRTLGIDPLASPDDVRKAYYALAKEVHPDLFLSPPRDVLHKEMEELFAQVLEAYNVLSDADARARYDATRAARGLAPKVAAADQATLAKENYARGRILLDQKKPAEALKFLQNAVDLEPNRPEYLRLLGIVQVRNPRLRAEAEMNMRRSLEMDPARPEVYIQLGILYRKSGETEKAIQVLRECLKWDPKNVEAGTALAELTRNVGSRS